MGLFDRVFSWACHRVFKRVDVDGSGTIGGLEIEVSMLPVQAADCPALLDTNAVSFVQCCMCRSQSSICVSVAGDALFPMQDCLQMAVLSLGPSIASRLSS